LVLAVVVLPPAAEGRPGLAARMLSGRAVVLIGLCSYSIFLWHEPLVRLLRSQGLTLGGRAGLLVNLAFVAALTAAVSAATYKWVEQPALRKRAASRRETPTRG
jgi:peptidoglycan/LPS O-acetylase OafA/YrhL